MKASTLKRVRSIHPSPPIHWVGDGFPVRSILSYQNLGARISPFLLLDYGGPVEFPPTDQPRGVDEHPHRGFETVTIVYQGALEHRDSTGNQGRIGPGDVQWMTAASGIVHEEKHAREFARNGGTMEMVQLWVNLPARDKMSPPGYQTLLAEQIPTVSLPGGAGLLRVIAGTYADEQGSAHTFSPVNVWDLRLNAGHKTDLSVPDGYNTILFVLHGAITLNGSGQAVRAGEMALLDPEGEGITLEAQEEATLLVLNGEPIDEPVVSYGPFVMNTQEEIAQAIQDYRSGKMGQLG